MMSGDRTPKTEAARRTGWWRPVVLLVAVVTLMVLAGVFNVGTRLGQLRTWIQSIGVWGPVVFVLIYVAATVGALPGSAMTVAAGALFGSVSGVALVSVASTTGAALAFLVSRYFAREAVARRLLADKRFRRLDRMTETRGAAIVAITRLVPLFPFNLLNYGFGLTAVRFWTYVFWSWLCMLPGTVLYVVGADAVFSALSENRIPWVLIGIVMGTLGLLAIVARVARSRLQKGSSASGGAEASGPRGDDDE
jgi:uncharacterized membrane protein YdjX (TVP38/TMEM64 family)